MCVCRYEIGSTVRHVVVCSLVFGGVQFAPTVAHAEKASRAYKGTTYRNCVLVFQSASFKLTTPFLIQFFRRFLLSCRPTKPQRKDMNILGWQLLRPGGMLVTFSCSGGVDSRLFQQIIGERERDAGV